MAKQLLSNAIAAFLLVTAAVGCSKDASGTPQPVLVGADTSHALGEKFYVVPSTLWPDPGHIPVCWEDAGLDKQKAWIKDAVKKAWELPEGSVRFTGWGRCTKGAPGIHIVNQSEDGPHTIDLGNRMDGVDNGMVLDMNFKGQGFENCHDSEKMLEQCNRGVAAHEMGHALGFMHEQERSDTPTSCPDKDPLSEPGAKTIGKWDLMSIMNYCYPDRDTVYPDEISAADKAGLLQMYPASKGADTTPTGDDDDDPSASDPSTQSRGDEDVGDDDDDDDDDDSTSSKKKKSSSKKSSTTDAAATASCSAAPRSASSASGLGWLLGVSLFLVARRRRQGARVTSA